ncbi:unnamed protein product [Paramecium pentaurelia]|uniref:WD domain, G-beta repeat protein n=1 Tax=Paramecium pentaurelia TaxID=43138 RepID=A0A8S1TG36_9CILI|nr:unnamed protein product [Paramecium pentaurelia]
MNQNCNIPDHETDVEFLCTNEQCKDFRVFCFKCLQNEKHNTHIKDVQKIKDFGRQQINKSDEDLIFDLEKMIDHIYQLFFTLKEELKFGCQISEEELNGLNLNQLNDLLCSKIKFRKEKQSLISMISKSAEYMIETIYTGLNEFSQQQFDRPVKKVKQEMKTLKYELIDTIQDEQINSFAFNQDASLMVGGYESSKIQVFEFKKGQLKMIQQLNFHKKSIYCQYFMKKSDGFLSGSCDKTISICYLNDNQKWDIKQRLEGHQGGINCLLMNRNEDLLISSSDDMLIKFWIKDNDLWECSQTIGGHSSFVSSISLNTTENQLVSCSKDSQILIHQYDQEQKMWMVFQIIKIKQWGRRLCFINDQILVFQPEKREQMHIYQLDSIDKYFVKTKEVIVGVGSERKKNRGCFWFFPQQYVQQKQIVLNKNGCCVNLIKKVENDEFATIQSIDFQTKVIFGRMTDDGEYLITWDDRSGSIQIRKYVD